MEKIVAIVYVEVLILPFLSYMLYDFMQEGMIFGRYGKWLETINPFLAKPLGLCLKCFHVWVVIGFTLLFLDFELSKFIISLGASYVILDKSFFK
jgi:hypothetical protein